MAIGLSLYIGAAFVSVNATGHEVNIFPRAARVWVYMSATANFVILKNIRGTYVTGINPFKGEARSAWISGLRADISAWVDYA